MESKFTLSKSKLLEQYNKLKELNLKISYSYKTNREVGNLLQELKQTQDCEFSIHNTKEIEMIKNKNKIWFFLQAQNQQQIQDIIKESVINFAIDNEIDLNNLLAIIKQTNTKVNLLLRMKFQEHRIGTGRYFVYGLPAVKINKIISKIKNNPNISKLGIHIHRKSQNTSEWEIIFELKDSLTPETLKRINIVNLGGGLPVKYKSHSTDVLQYIFEKIKQTSEWLKQYNIETYIEPGRFLAAPPIKLQTQIIQIHNNTIVINCSLYNSALDTHLTDIRMLIENELSENSDGRYYLIKGNTPTRDDIFRYKVKLKNPKVGDTITFLNAGAYNYTTDFCCLKKLETEISEQTNASS